MGASRLVRSIFLLFILGFGARLTDGAGQTGALRRAATGKDAQTQGTARRSVDAEAADELPQPTVFLAVGSAPKQFDLRDVLRRTWLKDCADDPKCDYRFFTDQPRFKHR